MIDIRYEQVRTWETGNWFQRQSSPGNNGSPAVIARHVVNAATASVGITGDFNFNELSQLIEMLQSVQRSVGRLPQP